MSRNPIKQVTIIDKSGLCTLHLAYWGPEVDQIFFNKLLAQINCYLESEIGLDRYEICLEGYWMFVSRNEASLITVIVDDLRKNDSGVRSRILDFLDRVQELIEHCHYWEATPVRANGLPTRKTFLREQIEMEITRIFPTPWDHLLFDEQFLADVAKIRILTVLADQHAYTLKEINEHLHLGLEIINERLKYLLREKFIQRNIISSGEAVYRTYAIKYSITEMGKLALDTLDSGFPGMWFQEQLELSGASSEIFS